MSFTPGNILHPVYIVNSNEDGRTLGGGNPRLWLSRKGVRTVACLGKSSAAPHT